MLSSPVVLGPLTPCSKVVRVQGQLPDATVRVLATSGPAGSPGTRVVGEDTVGSGSDGIKLTGAPLKPGERVTAEQRTASDAGGPLPPEQGVEVLAEPVPDDLTGLYAPETLVACGRCLWVGGTEPGATVTLQINGDPPLHADTAADAVKFVLPGGRRLHANDSLLVSQSACGLSGTAISLPAPVATSSGAWILEPPIITQPLVRCQRAVHLEDVEPGATVVVQLDGAEHRACFGSRQGWFWLPRPLDVGDKVGVRQEFDLCEARSEGRSTTVTEAVPPPPGVIRPVCEGDRLVRVDGLVAGALVELALDGQPLCRGAATDSLMTFGVPLLRGGRELTARQSLCGEQEGDWSAWSAACPVRPLGPQPALQIVEPLIDRGVAIGVRAAARGEVVSRGTFVQVVGHRGMIGEAWGNGDERLDVPLWFALQRGERIHLRTRRCGEVVDEPAEVRVRGAREVAVPRVADPACDCGGSVLVRGVTPGAVVEVARSRGGSGFQLVGIARAGDDTVSVDVPPLRADDKLSASQRMGPTRSAPGPAATAPVLPHWAYVTDSAFRLCQLTQDWDPTGRPHPGPTTPIGLTGTDLGVPVEHAGVLYLFFGDCAEADGVETDADPIAWLTTADPDDLETAAPDLHWVVGSNGNFRRLSIAGGFHPLRAFEVPTGGFSYDGRLFLFIGMDRRDEPHPHMTSSRLVVADHPGQDFVLLLAISNSSGGQILVLGPGDSWHPAPYPGGRWMVHISPTVVRNADWPGLPSSTGDGLLMFGSSAYLGMASDETTGAELSTSNVYLAWAPLSSGVQPPRAPIPDPADWHFFTGRTSDGDPLWGTLRAGSTPQPLLPPDPGGSRLVGEISAVWYPALRRWVLAGSTQAPVNVARHPWGPWTTSDVICHPGQPHRDAGNLEPGGRWNDTNFSYAPYLVRRWLRWDRSIRQATLYYTFSVFDQPNDQVRYQPQLMRSRIACWS